MNGRFSPTIPYIPVALSLRATTIDSFRRPSFHWITQAGLALNARDDGSTSMQSSGNQQPMDIYL